MLQGVIFCFIICFLARCEGFKPFSKPLGAINSISVDKRLRNANIPVRMLPSELIAMGDYANEIERATGPEIYGPIFRAGLLLFASGVISACITTFLVVKFDKWKDLEDEFKAGKESQLADMKKSEEEAAKKKASSLFDQKEPELSEQLKNLDL
eukprot:gene9726-10760_t